MSTKSVRMHVQSKLRFSTIESRMDSVIVLSTMVCVQRRPFVLRVSHEPSSILNLWILRTTILTLHARVDGNRYVVCVCAIPMRGCCKILEGSYQTHTHLPSQCLRVPGPSSDQATYGPQTKILETLTKDKMRIFD